MPQKRSALPSNDAAKKKSKPIATFWTRSFGNTGDTFYLPGETVPTPPAVDRLKRNAKTNEKLRDATKRSAQSVFKRMMDSWKPLDNTDPTTYDQLHCLTNAYAFMNAFSPVLESLLQEAENRKETMRAKELRKLLTDIKSPNLHNTLFSSFLGTIDRCKEKPDFWGAMLEQARVRRTCLANIRGAGRRLRNQTTYVGLERLPESEQHLYHDKRLVELHEFVEVGLSSGALKDEGGDKNYVVLDGAVHRVTAPLTQQATSIIFWTKEGPSDTIVTAEKIFGAVIYNIEHLCSEFSPTNERSFVDCKNANELLMTKNPVERDRLVADGKMSKGMGPQSSRHVSYFMEVPKAAEEYGESSRVALESMECFLVARHEALLEAFLPEFAVKRRAAAEAANLLNALGYPSLSNFVTFRYAASVHWDKDASPTSGWVINRPLEMHLNTNNFFFASHGMILELRNNTRWFWEGFERHGTTVSSDTLANPAANYTRAAICKQQMEGQWTRASVLPKAVSHAHR